jgi:enoyl-CoA hydratase
MTYEHLLVAIEEPIAVITLNRPKVLNALNQAVMREVAAALEACDQDARVRCAVLWGGPRAFAAGADVNEFKDRTPGEMLRSYRFLEWERIRRVATPVIAAVTGYALGGGCELAMACDIIIAAETAQFGQPEISLGVIPGAGGTQRLTRAVGKSRAMEMILTGRPIGAAEAYAAGLVARVVPPELCLDEAKALAREIASRPPLAVRTAKEAVLQAFETPLADGILFERRCFNMLFGTADAAEGFRAFLEKRAPKWTGL